jgi:hexosaminidase
MSRVNTEFILTNSINEDGQFCSTLKNSSDIILDNFLICFSLLAPLNSIDNCHVTNQVGGYVEISQHNKSSLLPGQDWSFKYAYEYSRHKPMNHTWGPQGVFLKLHDGSIISVYVNDLNFQTLSSKAPIAKNIFDKSFDISLRLVPHPCEWIPSAGVCNLSQPLNLLFDDSEIITSAVSSASELGKRLNLDIYSSNNITDFIDSNTTLIIKVQKHILSSSYILVITSDVIELTASDEQGLFYGLVTLLQLNQTYHKLIPCGTINDQPRFNWRGQHLDCARHFYAVESILKLLDLMCLFKLNKFHWHGTDDESFRFKLDSNPELATATAKRGDSLLVPPIFGSGPSPTGGSYDSSDINRIIERASSNYIDVMPEFDLPGHNLSLIQLFPSTRDPRDKSNEVSVQGYFKNTLNPAMPDTYSIIEPLIDDLCNLFPGEYIHLGGDEMPPDSWTESPEVNDLKKKYNLQTNKDVLSWFINKLSARVESNGKKTATWQEAEDGSYLEKKSDKLLFAWQNLESGYKLARKGFKVVLCPAEHIYFDMAQSQTYSDRGVNWAAIVSLEDTVDWQIIPSDEPELESNIEGIQGHLWSETITQDSHMEAMLCPRIIGLSESAWTPDGSKRKGNELNTLVHNSFRSLFNQIGWDYYRSENFAIISDSINTHEEGLTSESVHTNV